MTRRARARTIFVACMLMVPLGAGAQEKERALSLDLSIGLGSSHTTGEYTGDPKGPALDALLALRLRAAGSGATIVGVSTASQGQAAHDLLCVISSTGGCTPYFPAFRTIGALVGWESAGAPLRVVGGPAYVMGDGAGALGLQGRLDGALPVTRHLAFVASVRGTMISEYRDDGFRLLAFGAGFRIR